MTKEQIFEFIKEQKTAMISSVDEEGFPNTKAMLTAYGAYKDNLPTGIIATREGGITYLPMKYKYQEFKL